MAKSKAVSATIVWTIIIITMSLFLPSAILLGVGLLPTIVAWLIDRTPGSYSALCVGCMNMAAVLPFALTLWTGGNDISEAIQTISNVWILFVMYGGAAVGWMFYYGVPVFVVMMSSFSAEHQISVLEKRRRELLENWGDILISGSRQSGED